MCDLMRFATQAWLLTWILVKIYISRFSKYEQNSGDYQNQLNSQQHEVAAVNKADINKSLCEVAQPMHFRTVQL